MTPIPRYSQTAGFSCGAASLVMALHHLRGLPVTRSSEFELWRDGTLIGLRGMDQWGLALPALKRGVPAIVIAEAEMTFPEASDVAKARFTPEDIELSQFIQGENRVRAEAAGVRWERREPSLEDIRKALAAGQVPVLLVDLFTLSNDYAAPHWVVGVAMEGDTLVLHDPDPDGPGVYRLSPERVHAVMDVSRYLAKRTLVVFGP
ncbi:MAG TPA: peptidase C39 family protein [Candidatus Thermoplasmatota archaeon]|nr:peptidase C39 family protein [Candidatus Thermoplasmatota archaeon]